MVLETALQKQWTNAWPDEPFEPKQNLQAFTTREQLQHLRWVLRHAETLLNNGYRVQAHRCIGFVQGAAWALKFIGDRELQISMQGDQTS